MSTKQIDIRAIYLLQLVRQWNFCSDSLDRGRRWRLPASKLPGTITAPMQILVFHLKRRRRCGNRAFTFAAVIETGRPAAPTYAANTLGLLFFCCCALASIPGVLGSGVYLLNILNARRQREPPLFLVLGATILTMSLFNLYRALRDFSTRYRARPLALAATHCGDLHRRRGWLLVLGSGERWVRWLFWNLITSRQRR